MTRQVRVRGIEKKELDADKLAYVFWILAKHELQAKRQRDQQERDEREARKAVRS